MLVTHLGQDRSKQIDLEDDLALDGDREKCTAESGEIISSAPDLSARKNNRAFTVTNRRYRVLWLGNAMIAACTSGRLPIVKALLEKGADEKAPFARPYGTCLAAACDSGNVDLVKFFIGKVTMEVKILQPKYQSLSRHSHHLKGYVRLMTRERPIISKQATTKRRGPFDPISNAQLWQSCAPVIRWVTLYHKLDRCAT